MRKTVIIIAVILSAVMFSCGKEDRVVHNNGGNVNVGEEGTLGEGIYKPSHRIIAVVQGTDTLQNWTWGTSKLASVSDVQNDETREFDYTGDMLGNVTVTSGEEVQTIQYTYGGSLVTKMEVVNGSQVDVTMNIHHDADDKISTIGLVISDDYAIQMALGRVNFKSILGRLIGRNAFEGIAEMLALSVSDRDAKMTVENKYFSIAYEWDGANIVRETLTGNLTATAALSDVADAFNFSSISSFLSYFGNNEHPLESTIERVTTYTYDAKRNPLWYYWGDGIGAQNLSRNNILTATTTGSVESTITVTLPDNIPMLGGTTRDFNRSTDLSGEESHTYIYNAYDLPASVTTDGTTRTYVYSD